MSMWISLTVLAGGLLWVVKATIRALIGDPLAVDRPSDPMGALEASLADGDPCADAPDIEMGVWLSPEQADELDCLAAETWPRHEYLAILTEHKREAS